MAQAGLAMRPAFFAYHGFWRILDYIYPPKCVSCQRLGYHLCADCVNQIVPINGAVCDRCGEPRRTPGLCQRCRDHQPKFRYLRSYAIFEGILREALHSLKYNRNISMGDVLCNPLINLLSNYQWDIDMVVPVPLGFARMRERGYNQSAFLALPVALAKGWTYQPAALRRIRETESQVNLSAANRLKNVMGAFESDSRLVRDKQVLVIDDVATTAATMTACAQALLDAGAGGVYGITLARAINRTN